MKLTKIKIKELVEGKKSYPSWSTGSSHHLKTANHKTGLLVYYLTNSNNKVSRVFPESINLSQRLSYALGLLKGEGATSLGNSNYRRFTLTNSDPNIINLVLDELHKNELFFKSKLIDKSIHLIHFTKTEDEVIDYWSKKLNLTKNKFKCFEDKKKTTPHGVCHVYISDVLLRRVIDLIHDKFNE